MTSRTLNAGRPLHPLKVSWPRAAASPERCGRCPSRVMQETDPGDWMCIGCGHVMYASSGDGLEQPEEKTRLRSSSTHGVRL